MPGRTPSNKISKDNKQEWREFSTRTLKSGKSVHFKSNKRLPTQILTEALIDSSRMETYDSVREIAGKGGELW